MSHVDGSLLGKIAGIDFGTSNSSVGFFNNNAPELLEIPNEGRTVPSAIFYSSESTETTFGRQALASYTQGIEGRLLRSLKSVLGTSLMKEKTQIRNKRVGFPQIIQDYFAYLKAQLDAHSGDGVDHVVLGRPVHFVDDDSQRDEEAESQLRAVAETVGFKHIEFQFEPIAAALNYENTITCEELVVIVDIGGGTADFSVLRLSPQRHTQRDRASDVLGNMGVHIGGTDFDRLLSLHSVMPALGYGSYVKNTERLLPGSIYFDLAAWHRIPLLYNPQSKNLVRQMLLDASDTAKLTTLETVIEQRLGHALARTVEKAKIDLSDHQETAIQLQHAGQSLVDCTVSRTTMEESIAEAVLSLKSCVQEGLARADVRADEIGTVFYTGGSSGIPCVRDCFERVFVQSEHAHGDTFGSVGLGLAIDAVRRFA